MEQVTRPGRTREEVIAEVERQVFAFDEILVALSEKQADAQIARQLYKDILRELKEGKQ